MAENEKTVDASTDDLNDFEDLFAGRVKETVKETPKDSDEAPKADEEIDADDNNNTADEDESSATEVEEETEEEKTPKKKQTAQERFDELTKARREAERRAEKAEAILEEYRNSQSKTKEKDEPKPEEKPESLAPDFTDKDKYPLGDLDPQYNQDMLDYMLEKRMAEFRKEQEAALSRKEAEAEANALQSKWNSKLTAAEETYEDFRETVSSLENAFRGVDPQHGQFIAETVMGMEKGTDVLYHLAKNPEIVSELIRATPVNAALALGRLEATFVQEKPKPKVKETKAPPPPKEVTKGTNANLSVKPDTDDLDAFENVFYNKK